MKPSALLSILVCGTALAAPAFAPNSKALSAPAGVLGERKSAKTGARDLLVGDIGLEGLITIVDDTVDGVVG
ncbi:hypothetical protein V496_10371 [Pseudogymnoascus sp. VKM F-4515 (FW-2607)]|nr:hypothetical protein V496_10371 [Pseudogymnoascus sp. VKM F-4515 (FW-2607)]KFY70812.1 hypothetical protein V498_10199 [Pseudogymnoascus sp. VKM F-4517 (FW-2822)]